MSRIDARFAALRAANRKALIPFVTAGDPALEATVPIMRALVDAGADVLELGVPFSDPMADGPVIQRAIERSLARGTTLRKTLDVVAKFRETNTDTPIVLPSPASSSPIERQFVSMSTRSPRNKASTNQPAFSYRA